MEARDFLLMRHELLLVIAALGVLVIDLALPREKRKTIVLPATVIFALVTIIGFFPCDDGILFGGMYRTNALIVLMKNILNFGVLLVFMQSGSWFRKDSELNNRVSEFFILILSTLIGMNFMISSGDFLMFYIGLELSTIPIAALAAYDRSKQKSAESGIKMILSAALASGATLFGISFLYGVTGSVYFHEVQPALAAMAGEETNPMLVLGTIFFFTGLAFKISIVPFHLWTADVYEGAPVPVTSYLSVISKGAAVFIFIIVLFTVFPQHSELWRNIVYGAAILTMTIGNLFAIRQQNLKRFLAFSSVAQAGFILLGVIAGTQTGMSSVIYFILIYVFSNLGAFGVVAAIQSETGLENRDDYNGLYKTNPKLSLVMTLSLFSLAGIPPVAGFFGKFFLFTAAAEQGFYLLVLIATLNAIVSLYYYLLVVKAMFIMKTDSPVPAFQSDNLTRAGLVICVIGMIAIGFIRPLFDVIFKLSIGI